MVIDVIVADARGLIRIGIRYQELPPSDNPDCLLRSRPLKSL